MGVGGDLPVSHCAVVWCAAGVGAVGIGCTRVLCLARLCTATSMGICAQTHAPNLCAHPTPGSRARPKRLTASWRSLRSGTAGTTPPPLPAPTPPTCWRSPSSCSTRTPTTPWPTGVIALGWLALVIVLKQTPYLRGRKRPPERCFESPPSKRNELPSHPIPCPHAHPGPRGPCGHEHLPA